MNEPLRAVVFDFDGLILDTEVPDLRSWQETFTAHGAELDTGVWNALVGTAAGSWDPYRALAEATGRPVDRPAVRAARRACYAELVARETVRPGVAACLREARRRSLRIGLASSSDRPWVRGHLERLGLLADFDALATGDEVTRAKPDPELYTLALRRLGIPPGAALALEDSPNGAAAARAAGLRCVIVPNDVTRHLPLDAADLVLDSLEQLDLDALPA
jgi:HAD superfamily hydrolase (TIGR01509 family)